MHIEFTFKRRGQSERLRIESSLIYRESTRSPVPKDMKRRVLRSFADSFEGVSNPMFLFNGLTYGIEGSLDDPTFKREGEPVEVLDRRGEEIEDAQAFLRSSYDRCLRPVLVEARAAYPTRDPKEIVH